MRKLLEITTGRHPFQVAVVAACPVTATAVLVSGELPPSLATALPGLGNVWLGILLAGGVTAQVGAYWRGRLDTGLIIEAGGMCLLAAMLTVYVCALIWINGAAAVAPAAFMGGMSVAAWWRIMQLANDVRKVWRARAEGLTSTVRVLRDPGPPAAPTTPGTP